MAEGAGMGYQFTGGDDAGVNTNFGATSSGGAITFSPKSNAPVYAIVGGISAVVLVLGVVYLKGKK